MRKGSIFNRFLMLMVVVIIIPILLAYWLVSSALIESLYVNYNQTVQLTADVVSQTLKEAIGSVVDVSISVIGNDKIRDYLICEKSDPKYLEKYAAAQTVLNNYYLYNSYIYHICVDSTDSDRLISGGYNRSYVFSGEEKEQMLSTNGSWFWSRETKGRFAICRLIKDVNNYDRKIGFVKIIVNEENLRRQFYMNHVGTQYTYAIVDAEEGSVVLSTNEEDAEKIQDILRKMDTGYTAEYYVQRDSGRYFVYKPISINTKPSYLVLAASDQTSYYTMMRYGILFLVMILFVAFYALYAAMYRKNISLPLHTLGMQMKQMKPDSGAPGQVMLEAKGEVKELINSFNAMSRRLDYLYETNYKNELKLRDANLLILQSEINPHFLYNVLDSIRWMIELGDREAASGMIQKLSEMFRLTLLSEKSTIRLEKELEHLEKYIALEEYRFKDKLHFHVNIQENTGSLLVVKFVLQPLVENAIVHGIAEGSGYGNVVISVYISDGKLIYDIRDDGCGADPKRIEEILNQDLVKKNSLEGFALANIHLRLQMRYGKDYGIEYRRREEGGSIFTVKQPLVYEEGENHVENDDRG